jgi:nicotinate-nucleotide pyrophosphorylase (carboxylating)
LPSENKRALKTAPSIAHEGKRMPQGLPDSVIEPIVRLALAEDFGRYGDLTSEATIPADHLSVCEIKARLAGVIAGFDAADLACRLVSPNLRLERCKADGQSLQPGDVLGRLDGPTRDVLAAERTVLNFLGRLSGVATLTAQYVKAVAGTNVRIVDTRKTTPGLRALEKQAVRLGGGTNHRFGLDDAILIKDNHIAACGSVREAIKRAKAALGHLRMIEVEVDTLDQLETLLEDPPHVVLLDNMAPQMLRQAVQLVAGRCKTEASGGVTLETVAAIAKTGVDYISVGALTHSAVTLDIGLDWLKAR